MRRAKEPQQRNRKEKTKMKYYAITQMKTMCDMVVFCACLLKRKKKKIDVFYTEPHMCTICTISPTRTHTRENHNGRVCGESE